MSVRQQDGESQAHRARVFPLPYLQLCKPSCSSARNRARFRLQCIVVTVTNRCIETLNRLYAAPSFLHSHLDPHATPPLVVIPPLPRHQSVTTSSSLFKSSANCSASQFRLLVELRRRCSAFALKARTECASPPSACDIDSSALKSFFDSFSCFQCLEHAGAHRCYAHSTIRSHGTTPHSARSTSGDSLPSASESEPYTSPHHSLPTPPSTPTPRCFTSHSTAATPVVPLIADRVSLPVDLRIVPLLSVLPPDLAHSYSDSQSSALLRPAYEVQTLNMTSPLKPPRVAGSRREYVRLIGRMVPQGMVGFTAEPECVNGVFCVAKDDDSDRLIIDAQPANRLFVDPPPVALPDPSHLVLLHAPAGQTVQAGKSDLSNYYHHLGLPRRLQPYFALPPLTRAELIFLGLPTNAPYPVCLTVPMGWTHAVPLAQGAHQHIVYSSGALSPDDNLLALARPTLTHHGAIHGIIVDDFFIFSLSQKVAQEYFDRVIAAYRRVGFIIKESKLVAPTSRPVKVIGFNVDGAAGEIALPVQSQLSLIFATISALRCGVVTGIQLAQLIGRWTWCMLLRRPSLSVLQHAYRYAQVAQRRRFTLWPSVRRELHMLIGLLPLLTARMHDSFFERVIASDASELAAGVVSMPLSNHARDVVWPMSSNRRNASLQTRLLSDAFRDAVDTACIDSPSLTSDTQLCIGTLERFYSLVESSRWSIVLSSAWRGVEHINALELRAVLLAVHWVLSHPHSLCRRVFILVDSTVAFFSLWKGRSSSPALLFVLRKIAALSLASGLSLLPSWVPSEVNPADAPSRLVAPLARGAADAASPPRT